MDLKKLLRPTIPIRHGRHQQKEAVLCPPPSDNGRDAALEVSATPRWK